MKKYKIKIAEGAFDAVPEHARDGLQDAIKEAFSDFDPNNPPGTRVDDLADGQKTCPKCGAPLVESGSGAFPLPSGDLVKIVDCEDCDVGYCVHLKD